MNNLKPIQMKRFLSFFFISLFLGLSISDCKKNESIFSHNNYTEIYLGTWDFKYVWSNYDQMFGIRTGDSTTFTGVIYPGPSDGYITIVYTEDNTLTKKVESDGKILNTCEAQNHGSADCSGYFEGNSVLHYNTYQQTPPNQVHLFTSTLIGRKLSNINTLNQKPTVTTTIATGVSTTYAILHGIVNPNFLFTTVTFEYGTSSSYGDTISAVTKTILGYKEFNASVSISGLTPGTEYHFRVKAVNSLGTTYGNDMKFNTSLSGSVIDIDGNVYKTIQIGSQIWMDGNLKVTKFNDGNTIPLVTDSSSWGKLTTPGYTWFNNDVSTNKATMGAFYNWYAVNTGKLCPMYWHVPDSLEWSSLENISALTVLPSGGRRPDGSFFGASYPTSYEWYSGNEWTSSTAYSYNKTDAFSIFLYYSHNSLTIVNFSMNFGYPVRCVKDN